MTLIPFAPNNTVAPPFAATVTLDGSTYQMEASWNISGQRWYIEIYDQNQNLILSTPLIGSPPNSDIYIGYNLFTSSTIVYRPSTGNIEIDP